MTGTKGYLNPTATMDCDNQLIRERAQALTQGVSDAPGKAKSLFYWVRDEIEYSPLVPLELFEDYRASRTLERGKGFCVEKAAVLAAWMHLYGVAAKKRLNRALREENGS